MDTYVDILLKANTGSKACNASIGIIFNLNISINERHSSTQITLDIFLSSDLKPRSLITRYPTGVLFHSAAYR